MKRISRLEADLCSTPAQVFALITSMDASWRSDLTRIEETPRGFIEYTSNGIATEFVITCKRPGFYSFTLQNIHMRGEWTGELFPLPTGGTHLIFTETVHVRNPIMWLFAKRYLSTMQYRYLCDLKSALNETK